tara:strand:- start:512 stop:757 length:246 start_codon:yes stop_codon:yes gene_type:complete
MRGGHHLYKRLGVRRNARTSEIKKAYEKIKKKKKKVPKRVKEAYKILSNTKTRKKYLDSYKHKKTKKRKRRNQRGCSRKKR